MSVAILTQSCETIYVSVSQIYVGQDKENEGKTDIIPDNNRSNTQVRPVTHLGRCC